MGPGKHSCNMTRFIVALLLFYSYNIFATDSSKDISSNYKKLCNIYTEVTASNKDEPDISLIEMEIASNVQKKLPELFNQMYVHVISSMPNRRYSLINEYAKAVNQIDRECEAANAYFTNRFQH